MNHRNNQIFVGLTLPNKRKQEKTREQNINKRIKVSSIVWSIGRRDVGRCDILLDGSTISGVHASLNYMDGKFYLIDNMSRNDSYLIRNGVKIALEKHTEILPNDAIVFGASEFGFDELLEGTSRSRGREVRVLSVSSGRDISKPTPKPKPKPSPKRKPAPVTPQGNTKKIRCMECMKPISSNAICPSCSSSKHLK